MNTYLIVAGFLTGGLALNHSTVGSRFIMTPLLQVPDIPPLLGSVENMRRVLRFSWHLTGVTLLGYAALLFYLASVDLDATARVILWLTVAVNVFSAGVVLVVSRGKHFSWPLFLIVAGATWLGLAQ